jgi:predicted secreted protein
MVGEAFEVMLADLPGAGYLWTPGDIPPGLTLIDTRQAPPATDVVGSPQSQVVRFRADLAGDYEIAFTFGRPWETVAAETQVVSVRVRERHRRNRDD